MSAIVFHTPSGHEAELRGSERAWLAQLIHQHTHGMWGFDDMDGTERLLGLVDMAGAAGLERTGHGYLSRYAREVRTLSTAGSGGSPGDRYGEAKQRFVSAVKTALRAHGLFMTVNGTEHHTTDLAYNTALITGSDPIRLAARIERRCEVHGWFDGPDRAWAAGLIETGLKIGLYRRVLHHQDTNGQTTAVVPQGWEDVQALLCERDDEPVVMSYTVESSFPNVDCSDMALAWPAGVAEGHWSALTDTQTAEREAREESWSELDKAEQWRRGMTWLREHRPWARIGPDNLATQGFGPFMTIVDVFAPGRSALIGAADHA
ncbi:hypothetical protein LO763_19695 [Glycomyces sp. A-F 0318]|uniref:hypothetical protein n=1 Tax=Glycomyces amatae TaxID=2881355 RepID=UPI001E55BE8B|nr:hypothetical protein [Glycomyces amatae]MCD0445836.1 hypothetical protein [Glycomyces amatae]